MSAPRAEPRAMRAGRPWAPRWQRGLLAFFLGAALLDSGLSALHVRIEWFAGLASFDLAFVLAMSVLPLAVGLAIGLVYGYGGKYLAHFPPLAVLGWRYVESLQHAAALPDGVHLLPWQLWAFFVIFQMEMCAVGAFFGEIVARRWMSWDHAMPPMRADSERLPEDDD